MQHETNASLCERVCVCVWGIDPHRKSALPPLGGLSEGRSEKQPGSVYTWLQHEERQDQHVHQLVPLSHFQFPSSGWKLALHGSRGSAEPSPHPAFAFITVQSDSPV